MANNRRTRGPLAVLLGLLVPSAALANDGFYFGGHVGYLFGTATATLGDPTGVASAGGTSPIGQLFGGVQARLADALCRRAGCWASSSTLLHGRARLAQVLSYRATPTGYGRRAARISRHDARPARLRHGRAGRRSSPAASPSPARAGRAPTSPPATRTPRPANGGWATRWAAASTTRSTRAGRRAPEYLYTNLGLTGFAFASAPARYDSLYDIHRFRVGLNYHFGAADDDEGQKDDDAAPAAGRSTARPTFIFQGYPPFNAPYDGTNSLPAGGPEPRDLDGVGLPRRAPVAGRRALLQSRAAAGLRRRRAPSAPRGYPNGEAQKSNFPFPRYNTSRLFLRQEIGLGGEREKVESEYGQLCGREGRLAAHLPGRQVRRARPVRQQRLCRGSAHRLPQLVDLGGRRLRLSGRPASASPRASPPSSTSRAGRCGSATSWSATSPTPTSST